MKVLHLGRDLAPRSNGGLSVALDLRLPRVLMAFAATLTALVVGADSGVEDLNGNAISGNNVATYTLVDETSYTIVHFRKGTHSDDSPDEP